jgi:hypothetical protein
VNGSSPLTTPLIVYIKCKTCKGKKNLVLEILAIRTPFKPNLTINNYRHEIKMTLQEKTTSILVNPSHISNKNEKISHNTNIW